MALALVMVSTVACTGKEAAGPTASAPSPSTASSTVAALPVLDVPETGQVIEHLVDRTGGWQAPAGSADDTGPLDVIYTCVGGGKLTVRITSPSRSAATVPCNGSVQHHDRNEAMKAGRVTVAIEPDGNQRWSLLLVRGMQSG